MIGLDELEKIARAATPGPWKRKQLTRWSKVTVAAEFTSGVHDISLFNSSSTSHENADHIAAFSPSTALALIAEIKKLRGALEKIGKQDRFEMTCDPADFDFNAEDAYRAGSHNAFCEVADMAREALKG